MAIFARIACAVVLAILCHAEASAQPRARPDRDTADCESGVPDRVIRGCTAVIARGRRESALNRAVAYFVRGSVRTERGDADGGNADLNAAIQAYGEAIAADRSNAAAWMGRGVARNIARDHRGAVEDLGEAITLLPDVAALRTYRGNAYSALGELDAAFADYTAAIERDRRQGEAFRGRGVVRARQRDLGGAIVDLSQAIVIDGRDAEALVERAKVHRLQGQAGAALADLTRAITLRPNHSAALALRGDTHRRTGNLDAALVDLDLAISLNPREAAALVSRGDLHFGRGDLPRAFADYDTAARVDPDQPAAFRGRADVQRLRGNHSLALADYARAIELNPENHFARFGRGEAHAALGNLAAARDDYSEALRLWPDYVEARRARARLFERLEQFPQAAADYEAVLSSRAADGESRQGLDRVRARMAAVSPTDRAPSQQQVQAQPPRLRQTRVALVIGNGAYVGAGFSPLRNPVNDAADMAAELRALGFEVLEGHDLTRDAMDGMLIRFARLARPADVAVVYFAGHGLQHGGINYLVPVDVAVEDAASLRLVPTAQSILRDLSHEGGPRQGVRVLILDACRDNGAVVRLGEAMRGDGPSRGLSRMSETVGMFIAYAAQPNAVARDGTQRNSPFTAALLTHLRTPGLELRQVFQRVRSDVVQATEGRQWPEVMDGLVGELVMRQ